MIKPEQRADARQAADDLDATRVDCGELYPVHWGAPDAFQAPR